MPDQDPMGPIIATRTMFWQNAAGVNIPTLVEIGLPFEDPAHPVNQGGWWYCRVRTTGLGNDQLLAFEGVDSVDALVAALSLAGVFVSISPMSAGLDWAMLPNWGFPVVPQVPAGGAGVGGGGKPC